MKVVLLRKGVMFRRRILDVPRLVTSLYEWPEDLPTSEIIRQAPPGEPVAYRRFDFSSLRDESVRNPDGSFAHVYVEV